MTPSNFPSSLKNHKATNTRAFSCTCGNNALLCTWLSSLYLNTPLNDSWIEGIHCVYQIYIKNNNKWINRIHIYKYIGMLVYLGWERLSWVGKAWSKNVVAKVTSSRECKVTRCPTQDKREVGEMPDARGGQVDSADGLSVPACGLSDGSVGTAEPCQTESSASKSGYKQLSREGWEQGKLMMHFLMVVIFDSGAVSDSMVSL